LLKLLELFQLGLIVFLSAGKRVFSFFDPVIQAKLKEFSKIADAISQFLVKLSLNFVQSSDRNTLTGESECYEKL